MITREQPSWAAAHRWYTSLSLVHPDLSRPYMATATRTPWSINAPAVPVLDQYNATVLSVHDCDTLDAEVSWGRRRYDKPQPIRLLGCNAAELKTPGGDAAAAYLKTLLPVGTQLVLTTSIDDKFAPRWDCAITFLLGGAPTDLVGHLITEQWAAPWNGLGVKPVPPWPRTVTP